MSTMLTRHEFDSHLDRVAFDGGRVGDVDRLVADHEDKAAQIEHLRGLLIIALRVAQWPSGLPEEIDVRDAWREAAEKATGGEHA